MNELHRPLETPAGPGGPGGVFADDDSPPSSITVASGPYAENLPLAGRTVGEIRARYRDRFDIDPRSVAVLDGHDTDDATVVRAGQVLMFMHRAGEKGAEMPDLLTLFDEIRAGQTVGAHGAPKSAPGREQLVIENREVRAISREGLTATMPVADWLAQAAPPRMDTHGVVLPDGIKLIFSSGPLTLWVHQSPPATYALKWIAADSRARFGPDTKYRTVRIALPYLIQMVLFVPGPRGLPTLSNANECFFRNAPLESGDDALHFPALLNCSKFNPPEGRPLCWICTQKLLRRGFEGETDVNRRYRAAFRDLRNCLIETGFNYSSDEHEGASWFTASRGIDPRIASVEAWQAATAADPLFVLEVPWINTGLSVRQMAERIFRINRAPGAAPPTASSLARIVVNHSQAA